jgi:hypothetical protein
MSNYHPNLSKSNNFNSTDTHYMSTDRNLASAPNTIEVVKYQSNDDCF